MKWIKNKVQTAKMILQRISIIKKINKIIIRQINITQIIENQSLNIKMIKMEILIL